MITFLIIAAVVLWLLWMIAGWLWSVLVIAFPYIVYILLFLLGLAFVAGVVWLFLPYKGEEDNNNSQNYKQLEDNS